MTNKPTDDVDLATLVSWHNQLDIFNGQNSDLSTITFADDVPEEFVALWKARIEANKTFWANWEALTGTDLDNMFSHIPQEGMEMVRDFYGLDVPEKSHADMTSKYGLGVKRRVKNLVIQLDLKSNNRFSLYIGE